MNLIKMKKIITILQDIYNTRFNFIKKHITHNEIIRTNTEAKLKNNNTYIILRIWHIILEKL